MKPAPPIRPAPPWVRIGLILLTVYVSVTRLVGIDYLLPHFSEPDQYLVPQTEFLWEGGHPKAAPLSFFMYYSLLPQVVALTPDPAEQVPGADPTSLEEQLRIASEPVVRVRLAVALLSILVAPLSYLLARRMLPAWDSLLAAALSSTSLLHVTLATQARPHAAQAALALLAVLLALRLRQRPSLANYALAGIGAALAVGELQFGVFVVPPLVIAHLLRAQPGGPDLWRRRPHAGALKLALAFVPIVASFLWFGPLFNEPQADTRNIRPPYGRPEGLEQAAERESYNDPVALQDGVIKLGPQRLELQWFDGSGFGRWVEALWWNDPVLSILGALGLALLVARIVQRWRAVPRAARQPRVLGALDHVLDADLPRNVVVAAAYALPFCLVLGSYARTWGRFLLPGLPYFACAAAFGVGWMIRVAGARMPRARTPIAVVAGVAVLALPVYGSLHRFRVALRPDTLEQACRWITEHVDAENARIVTGLSLTLPLFHREDALQANLQYKGGQNARWLCYQDLFLEPAATRVEYEIRSMPQTQPVRRALQEPESAREVLRTIGADYLVLEVSQRTMGFADQRGLHAAAVREGELVASFAPHAGPEDDILWKDYQDAPFMAWRNLRQRTLGPRIEIYRLGRDGK